MTNDKTDNEIFVTFLRIKTRIHWLDRQIVRKQLDIMPTYHCMENQGKLILQNWENGQKPQSGKFFDDFEVKNFQIAFFLKKNRFHSNWRLYLVLTSGQKPKKPLESFLRKISKCLILG